MCFKFWFKCGDGIFHSRRKKVGVEEEVEPRLPFRLVINQDMNGHRFLMQQVGERYFPVYDNYAEADYVDLLIKLRDMDVRDDDIFITGFAKSGISWVYTLVNMILDETFDLPTCSYEGSFLDSMTIDQIEMLNDKPGSRVLCSHFNLDNLPAQLGYSKARIIYVARNIKDVMLSMFEFLPTLQRVLTYRGQWDAYVDLELNGNFCYGSWFDHLKATDHFKSRHPKARLHILLYENLKMNTIQEIEKLCLLLGKSDSVGYPLAESTEFTRMKKNAVTLGLDVWSSGLCRPDSPGILRSGLVEEWRHRFDADLNLKVNKVFMDKMEHSVLGNSMRYFLGIPLPLSEKKIQEEKAREIREKELERERRMGQPVPPLEIIYGPGEEPVPETSKKTILGTSKDVLPGATEEPIPGKSKDTTVDRNNVPGASNGGSSGTNKEVNQEIFHEAVQYASHVEDERNNEDQESNLLTSQEMFWDARETFAETSLEIKKSKEASETLSEPSVENQKCKEASEILREPSVDNQKSKEARKTFAEPSAENQKSKEASDTYIEVIHTPIKRSRIPKDPAHKTKGKILANKEDALTKKQANYSNTNDADIGQGATQTAREDDLTKSEATQMNKDSANVFKKATLENENDASTSKQANHMNNDATESNKEEKAHTSYANQKTVDNKDTHSTNKGANTDAEHVSQEVTHYNKDAAHENKEAETEATNTNEEAKTDATNTNKEAKAVATHTNEEAKTDATNTNKEAKAVATHRNEEAKTDASNTNKEAKADANHSNREAKTDVINPSQCSTDNNKNLTHTIKEAKNDVTLRIKEKTGVTNPSQEATGSNKNVTDTNKEAKIEPPQASQETTHNVNKPDNQINVKL